MTEPIDLANVPNQNTVTLVLFAEAEVHHDESKYQAWLAEQADNKGDITL